MKQRIYLDTSVIGGCKDEEFSKWSNQLLNEFRRGKRIAVISELTRRELEEAPKEVREIVEILPEASIENVFFSEEAEILANQYLKEKVVTVKHIVDAQHIAIASVEQVDVLVSWNFQQIVNLNRIRSFNAVNMRLGYPLLEIRSPMEVVYEEEI